MTATSVPRLRWHQLPERLRADLSDHIGARVVGEYPQTGGFSPGLASRLVLDTGARIFVKAIHPDRDPRAVGLYRREAEIAAALPPGLPAPELLWRYDDGQWVALGFTDIDGRHPIEPWTADDLDRVLTALGDLADRLTPTPLTTVSLIEDLADNHASWRRARAEPQPDLDRLPAWARQNLDLLADLESGWEKGVAGTTLVHADLRADNLLLTPDRVWVIDWPYAATGAPYMDLLLFLPSAAAHGGVDPERVWERHQLAGEVDTDAVTSVIAAIAGDHLTASLQPDPPSIPGLRAHQRAKGEAALDWLRRRL